MNRRCEKLNTAQKRRDALGDAQSPLKNQTKTKQKTPKMFNFARVTCDGGVRRNMETTLTQYYLGTKV